MYVRCRSLAQKFIFFKHWKHTTSTYDYEIENSLLLRFVCKNSYGFSNAPFIERFKNRKCTICCSHGLRLFRLHSHSYSYTISQGYWYMLVLLELRSAWWLSKEMPCPFSIAPNFISKILFYILQVHTGTFLRKWFFKNSWKLHGVQMTWGR